MKILLRSKELILVIVDFCFQDQTKFLVASFVLFRLLYQVFVVSNENSTVAELASTLQADLSQLQAAASFVCRLGWAVKLFDPASVLQDPSTSHGVGVPDEEDGPRRDSVSSHMSVDSDAGQGQIWGAESNGPKTNDVRVAFVVDANITSYLMMGSVSPG